MRLKLSREEIEDCIKLKIPSISKFDWGELDANSIEVEIDVPMDKINKIVPEPIKEPVPEDVEKAVEKEVAQKTVVTPQTGNVMRRSRGNLPTF